MRKIKLGAASFWTILMGFISPIWIGSAYMDISGYGKGYSYDMGSEAEIAVFFWSHNADDMVSSRNSSYQLAML